MDVVEIVAEVAVGFSPSSLVLGLIERKPAGGGQQISVILPGLRLYTPASRKDPHNHHSDHDPCRSHGSARSVWQLVQKFTM